MNFFIIVLIIGLFVSLFSLFLFSRDDLTLLRKDVTLDKMFNLFFMDFFIGLLFSRAIFVVFSTPKMFLNPLAFLLFPYFPGLSLSGGVVSGILFLVFYCRSNRLPIGRILDFFSLSFMISLPVGYLGYFALTLGKNIMSAVLAIVYVVLVFIFIKYFYQMLLKGSFKDGSLSLIFFSIFALISLAGEIVSKFSGLLFLKQPENYLYFLLLIFSIFFFVRQERLIKLRRR